MAQFVDSYFADQFTDGSVRYNAAGIRDIATSQWRGSVGYLNDELAIRVFFDGVLTDVDAAKPVALVTADVAIKVFDSDGVEVADLPWSGWTSTGTGLYTETLGSLSEEVYVIELHLSATFTNPAVSGKTSAITGGAAVYLAEAITVDWVASSLSWAAAAGSTDPIFDGVDFATGFPFR